MKAAMRTCVAVVFSIVGLVSGSPSTPPSPPSASPDCSDLPISMNGGNYPNGCPGAVYANGEPAYAYCTDGSYPWWTACCVWENGACVAAELPPDRPNPYICSWHWAALSTNCDDTCSLVDRGVKSEQPDKIEARGGVMCNQEATLEYELRNQDTVAECATAVRVRCAEAAWRVQRGGAPCLSPYSILPWLHLFFLYHEMH